MRIFEFGLHSSGTIWMASVLVVLFTISLERERQAMLLFYPLRVPDAKPVQFTRSMLRVAFGEARRALVPSCRANSPIRSSYASCYSRFSSYSR